MRNQHAGLPFDTADEDIAAPLLDVSIPTLMLFHRGARVGSQVGAPGKAELRETIERVFGLTAAV